MASVTAIPGNWVEIENGALYTAKIMGVEKGEAGKPGLLSGVIYYGPQSCMGESIIQHRGRYFSGR